MDKPQRRKWTIVLFVLGLVLCLAATMLFTLWPGPSPEALLSAGAPRSESTLLQPDVHYRYFQKSLNGTVLANTGSASVEHGTGSESLTAAQDGTLVLTASQHATIPLSLGTSWTIMASARYLPDGQTGRILSLTNVSDTWFGWSSGKVGQSSVDGELTGLELDNTADVNAFHTVAVRRMPSAASFHGASTRTIDPSFTGTYGLQAVSSSLNGDVIMVQCADVWNKGETYVSVYRWDGTDYTAQPIFNGVSTVTAYNTEHQIHTCGTLSGDGSAFVYCKDARSAHPTDTSFQLSSVLVKFKWSEVEGRFEKQDISSLTILETGAVTSSTLWFCVQINHDGTMVEVTSPMAYDEFGDQFSPREARTWIFDDSAEDNAYVNVRGADGYFDGHSDSYPLARRAGWTSDKLHVILGATKHYARVSTSSTTWDLKHSLTFPSVDAFDTPQSVKWSSNCRRVAVQYAASTDTNAFAVVVFTYDLAGTLAHERTIPCSFKTYTHPSRPQSLGLSNEGHVVCMTELYGTGRVSLFTSGNNYEGTFTHNGASSGDRCYSSDVSADGRVVVYAHMDGRIYTRRATSSPPDWSSCALRVGGGVMPSDCALRELRVYHRGLSDEEMENAVAEMNDPLVVPHALEYGTDGAPIIGFVDTPLAAVTPSWQGSEATYANENGNLVAVHGLVLNQVTGSLSGTPSSSMGAQTVTFAVGNGAGEAVDRRDMVIYDTPAMSMVDRALSVGEALTASVAVVPPPDEWVRYEAFRITSGALPEGLILDAATGTISGTMRSTGSETLVVSATLSGFGDVSSNVFRITLKEPEPEPDHATPPPDYGTSEDKTVMLFEGASKMWFQDTSIVELVPSNNTSFRSFESPNALENGVSVDGTSGALTTLPSSSSKTLDENTLRGNTTRVIVYGTTSAGERLEGVVHLVRHGKQLTNLAYEPILRGFTSTPLTFVPTLDGTAAKFTKVNDDLWPEGLVVNEHSGRIDSASGVSQRASGLSVQSVLIGDVVVSNKFELRPYERIMYDTRALTGVTVSDDAGRLTLKEGVYVNIPLILPKNLSSAGDVVFTTNVALPGGLSIDPSTGTVYGTPQVAVEDPLKLWVETTLDNRYFAESYTLEVQSSDLPTTPSRQPWVEYTSYGLWGAGALCWMTSAWLALSGTWV